MSEPAMPRGELDEAAVIGRIVQLRREHFGRRGKVLFAAALGISPSTYSYYERGRMPPAAILWKICEVTGADLDWLLTGRDARLRQAAAAGQGFWADRGGSALFGKVSELLKRDPQAAAALNAFVDLLARKLPDEGVGQGGRAERSGRIGRLPILGRSAAGVIHFWQSQRALPRVTELADLIARHERSAHRETVGGDVSGESPMMAPLKLDSDRVGLVQLSQPDETGVAEFVQCAEICERYPDAFAVRIDGDSMAPRISDGDVVVLSPSVAARDHWPAVVQLHGQIGVTCKLFCRAGQKVQLIAVNEKYEPKVCRQDEVAWALAVLWRLRFR